MLKLLISGILISIFASFAWAGDGDLDVLQRLLLRQELARILKVGNPFGGATASEILGLPVTHHYQMEEDAFIQKMTLISPETNSNLVAADPALLPKIKEAQRRLYDSVLVLEDVRKRALSDEAEPKPKVETTYIDASEKAFRFSPGSSLTDIDENTPQILHIYDVQGFGPKYAMSMDQFYKESKNWRVEYLNTLKVDTFALFVYGLFARSEGDSQVNFSAGLEVVMNQFQKIIENRGQKFSKDEILQGVAGLVIRTYQAEALDNGMMNFAKYILESNNKKLSQTIDGNLKFLKFNLGYRLSLKDPRAFFLEENFERAGFILREANTKEGFAKVVARRAKYQSLKLMIACNRGLGDLK